MLTDVVPALALATEPAEPGVLARSPRDPAAPLFGGGDYLRLGRSAMEMAAAALGAWSLGTLRGTAGAEPAAMAFTALATAQILHTRSCRARARPDRPENPALSRAVAGTAALQIAALSLRPLRAALSLRSTPARPPRPGRDRGRPSGLHPLGEGAPGRDRHRARWRRRTRVLFPATKRGVVMKFHAPSFLLGVGLTAAAVAARGRLRPVVVEVGALGVHLGRLGRTLLEQRREEIEDLRAEVEERLRERIHTAAHGAHWGGNGAAKEATHARS
jgi:hypothetical protein